MTITINTEPADPVEPGCYIAGHRGQYAIDMLPEILESFDVEFVEDDDPRFWRSAAEADINGDPYFAQGKPIRHEDAWENRYAAADELLDKLNEATYGGYWHWQEGELLLQQTEVTGWLYVAASNYEEAWDALVEHGPTAGLLDIEDANRWARDEGRKLWKFEITATYEWPD